MPGKRRILTAVAAAVAVVAAVAVYAVFDPSVAGFFPRCPFYALTGLECPGCGTQRAIHALLSGDIAAAWHYNALLFVIVPFVAILAAAELLRQRYPELHKLLNTTEVGVGMGVLIVGWWVVRNLI